MEQLVTMPCQSDTSTYDAKHGYPMPKTVHGKLLLCIRQIFDLIVLQLCPPYVPYITQKFLFAPKPSTYTLEPKADGKNVYTIRLREGCEPLVTEEKEVPVWLASVDFYYIYPAHTERLACRYVSQSAVKETSCVFLLCHANSVDIGFDINIHYYMSWRLQCDVFAFDYSGYGQSSGKPSESNLCSDVMAAYNYLVTNLKTAPDKIVAFGQSLETAAAIELAKVPLKGLVLDGMFLSAFHILCPTMQRSLPCDQFENTAKIQRIQCPTLVIHGALDPITHLQHAERFFEISNNLVPPLIIPTGHHLDLVNYRAYWNRLEIFLFKEINGDACLMFYYLDDFSFA